jgi:hypothetical protein
MRLLRLFVIVMLASAFQMGWAQSSQQDDPGISLERDPVKSVHIFPNPATEFLHVKLEELPAEKVKLTLHSIIGNPMEIESEVVNEHELRIKVKDLASGYYFLAVKDAESKFRGMYKFLKR